MIDYNLENIKNKKIEQSWKEFLKRNDWDLFITFTFRYNPKDFNGGYKKVLEFFNNIKTNYNKMKFCGFSVGLINRYNINGTIHFHSLLTCVKSYPQTFNKIDLESLQNMWDYGIVDIIPIYNEYGIPGYISEKNLRLDNPDKYEVYFYRKNLILQLQEKGE